MSLVTKNVGENDAVLVAEAGRLFWVAQRLWVQKFSYGNVKKIRQRRSEGREA